MTMTRNFVSGARDSFGKNYLALAPLSCWVERSKPRYKGPDPSAIFKRPLEENYNCLKID
jgi:hypothetical protein